ncbi:MAG: sensor histidine kinase, partial [Sphingobium sp.]|nr:sensor histidine kinase [Sphingobium sp.]
GLARDIIARRDSTATPLTACAMPHEAWVLGDRIALRPPRRQSRQQGPALWRWRPHRDRGGRETAGTGLGLATARAIAQAHGGSVDARNRSAAGAAFLLTLPPLGPGPSQS